MNRILQGNIVGVRGLLRACTRCNLQRLTGVRFYTATRVAYHQDESLFDKSITINISWKIKTGAIVTTKAHPGMNLLSAARAGNIDLEGACEGVCACSTCHVILEDDFYDSIALATEEEDDMLDQAFGLTSSSRLGCQITLTADMRNINITLPKATRNMYVDGHVPQPH